MFYQRKLYALLEDTNWCQQLQCISNSDCQTWWKSHIEKEKENLPQNIASSSDRVNLHGVETTGSERPVRHPISGQERSIQATLPIITKNDLGKIASEEDAEKVFWWMWRFYPELLRGKDREALLYPQHNILPDCPKHSYRATVSALVGAMFPKGWKEESEPDRPYLLLFTFSPVQEFIKASRKFVDFWAGSYLLHYLGAKICWYIARKYGPDAVITPSLWSQEIIDALIVQEYQYFDFAEDFNRLTGDNPVNRFQNKTSTSLSTAGFPNVITALIPQTEVKQLGDELVEELRKEWKAIADNVRSHIKNTVINEVANLWEIIAKDFPSPSSEENNPNKEDLNKWQQPGCWQWNQLWDAQICNTWEPYWTAVPLGHPEQPLQIASVQSKIDETWKNSQHQVAQPRDTQPIPTLAEEETYKIFNVGTWWGSLQARLGQAIQAIKNTRTWTIPPAPGERSSLSGQFSAVHPYLLYNETFREGGGLSAGSMRLFWRVMAEVYPGLFNGSEKLNAIELTKRMAWQYGGVAESLGIDILQIKKREDSSQEVTSGTEKEEVDYEKLIRFPNLSAIASARFACDNPERVERYWERLKDKLIENNFLDSDSQQKKENRRRFFAKTHRPFQVPETDRKINPDSIKGKDFNGVMFSSKWLADDMGLLGEPVQILRTLVDQAHKECGFGDGSPADWWAIVLADGDSMGKYVSGKKLKEYQKYIIEDNVDNTIRKNPEFKRLLKKTKKRMGPATHVGLNRALLDFSNRLVPYLTEKRFCGKVVYSGGDDVMALLPLEDLPQYLLSLRAAWCGGNDPYDPPYFKSCGGYWEPQKDNLQGLPNRPLFTMGAGATMSMGIVIAYKSVPLPTVLENLWIAEKERAKKIPGKDGLCFRVIYGGGNVLEVLMKGKLLKYWCRFIEGATSNKDISSLLYRLAEELPRRAEVTEKELLFHKAASVIWHKSELSQKLKENEEDNFLCWLEKWEEWAGKAWQQWKEREQKNPDEKQPLGIDPEELGKLLRFSAFFVDKKLQREKWGENGK